MGVSDETKKALRSIRRAAAIAGGNLRGYRMPGHTEQPLKGKGVPYKRGTKHKNEDS